MSNQEEKQKLLDEIVALKGYISTLESTLVSLKFEQLQRTRELSRLSCNGASVKLCDIPDVQMELRRDLYRFLGMRCVRYKRRIVFEISSVVNSSENNLYAIEILIDDEGHGKLGKWVLPMYIDIHEILSQHPIDNLDNVRHFLKSCKHHIDCYFCRVKQFEELQDLLSGISNARAFSLSIGITRIELIMSGVTATDNNTVYNVTLCLYYKSAQTRPCKLLPDTDDDEKPSTNLLKRFNEYFKPFLRKDLRSAFLEISESQTEFIWRNITTNDDGEIIKSCDKSDGKGAGYLTTFLHRDNKNLKKNKNKTHDERNTSCDDEMESCLQTEEEECEDINVTKNKTDDLSGENAEIKSDVRKRPTRRTAKSRNTKKSHNGIKITKKAMKRKEENDGSITNIDKSVSNIASTVRRIPGKRKSKNRKKDINNLQVENEYISAGDFNHSSKMNGNVSEKDLSKKTDGEHKDRSKAQMSLDESANTNHENSMNSQQSMKKRKTITRLRQIKENTILSSDNTLIEITNSTPLSAKLPNRQKFFNASRISEILSAVKLDST